MYYAVASAGLYMYVKEAGCFHYSVDMIADLFVSSNSR